MSFASPQVYVPYDNTLVRFQDVERPEAFAGVFLVHLRPDTRGDQISVGPTADFDRVRTVILDKLGIENPIILLSLHGHSADGGQAYDSNSFERLVTKAFHTGITSPVTFNVSRGPAIHFLSSDSDSEPARPSKRRRQITNHGLAGGSSNTTVESNHQASQGSAREAHGSQLAALEMDVSRRHTVMQEDEAGTGDEELREALSGDASTGIDTGMALGGVPATWTGSNEVANLVATPTDYSAAGIFSSWWNNTPPFASRFRAVNSQGSRQSEPK